MKTGKQLHDDFEGEELPDLDSRQKFFGASGKEESRFQHKFGQIIPSEDVKEEEGRDQKHAAEVKSKLQENLVKDKKLARDKLTQQRLKKKMQKRGTKEGDKE